MYYLFLTATLGCLCFGQRVYAQSDTICRQAFSIVKTADRHHYQPLALDDTFARNVFQAFMPALDAEGLLFTNKQFAQLDTLHQTIDDDIRRGSCSFVTRTTHLYRSRLQAVDSLLRAMQREEIRVDDPDSLLISADHAYVNAEQLANKWRQHIKWQMLSSRRSDSADANKPWSQLQQETLDRQICRIQPKLRQPEEALRRVGAAFLKAVAIAYDPHTTYFSQGEAKEFENLLSKQAPQYGLEILPNARREMEITAIAPGSSAWDSNLLNEGDVILNVQTVRGTQDFMCIGWPEALRFLDSAPPEATFTVRKPSGRHVEVVLTKERLEVVDNVIQSFTLQKERKLGYIYLPSFYTDAETSGGCANDLAKELIRLKREGIEGLILDLRNNGGGSLFEAVQLAGIFVDFGAVALADARDQEVVALRDKNRGTVYNGPMVVLVDRLSASASELLAATLQDYQRAVIVGGRTFGKATAQQVVPLVGEATGNLSGYLKVTVGNFYRITGHSHQNRGVVPDIPLPTIYDYLEIGESTYPTAFDLPAVQKKAYYRSLANLPVSELQSRSESRQRTNHIFSRVERSGRWLDSLRYVPLTDSAFGTYWDRRKQLFAEFNSVDVSPLRVNRPSYLSEGGNRRQSEKTTAKIASDAYIREAYHIVNDLIDLSNN